jgi:ubiquinone/menaquinone biosynthesis C-methylase UbiE
MVRMPEMAPLARALITSPPYRAVTRWLVLPWALQGLRLRGEALEIGSGSGAMAAQMLRRFPDLQLTATDYDDQLVGTAQRTLARFGSRAKAQRADALALPYADGAFDVVLSFAMLHHVGGWERALAEAIRVIRPGGQLVGYDLAHPMPAWHAHHDDRGSRGMMEPRQMEAALGRLQVSAVRTRRSAGGFALRFIATKL